MIMVVGIFLIAGCGSSSSKHSEEVKVALGNGDEIKVSTHPGRAPAGFPTDIPLYPGAEIGQATASEMTLANAAECKSNEKQDVKTVSLTVKGKAAAKEVKSFYEARLPEAGWKLDKERNLEMSYGDVKQLGLQATKDQLLFSALITEGVAEDETTPETMALLYVQQCIKK